MNSKSYKISEEICLVSLGCSPGESVSNKIKSKFSFVPEINNKHKHMAVFLEGVAGRFEK